MKKIFTTKVVILSQLISSLGILLGGCVGDQKDSIFSQLNGHSINIKPNNQQSMSRWISTNIKTEPNIHNQLSYLESCISKKFNFDLFNGQHVPLQLKNGVKYLNPEEENKIKLLSGNGETGFFYVTWKYTPDQQKIFDLYRKFQKISAERLEAIIDEKISDFNPKNIKPIRPSIIQIRNAIQKTLGEKARYKITDDEKLMINFSEKLDLKLPFGTDLDIFPRIYLSKNQAKYSFKNDGALSEDLIQPKIKIQWYDRYLFLLILKDEIINSDDIWWGKQFGFSLDMNLGEYADDNSDLVDQLLSYDIHSRFRSIIPEDLDQYFSLSHTKLTEDVIVPATLYFNENNKFKEKVDNIVFERTIWIRGVK